MKRKKIIKVIWLIISITVMVSMVAWSVGVAVLNF